MRPTLRSGQPVAVAFAIAALLAAAPAAAQPFAQERQITPAYVTTLPTDGDIEIEGDLLAYGVRAEAGVSNYEGAVFLLGRDQGGAGNWGLLKKLTSPAPTANELFGSAVELQGEELFVTSVPPGGALFRVFGRNQGGSDQWGMLREVSEPDSSFSGTWGASMDVEGDVLVVGGASSGGGNQGRVFVYERDLGGPGNWGRRQVLVPADIENEDRFGTAVAISGNLLAVGAPQWDRPATSTSSNDGAVYLFRRDPTTGFWIEWRLLTDATSSGSRLGDQVALDGSTLLASRGGDSLTSVYRCWQGGPGEWGYLGALAPPVGFSFAVTSYGESIEIDGALAVLGGTDDFFVYDLYDWALVGDDLQTLSPSGTNWASFVALDGDRIATAGTDPSSGNIYRLDVFTAPTADLGVTVDDGQLVALPSATLGYELAFSNGGAAAVTGARLEVELTDAGLDLANVTWTCETSPGSGAGTACPMAAGTWEDFEDGPLAFDIEPGDLVTISLDAPVLADPEPPIECRARVRPPALQAVDLDPSDNQALDRDLAGGSIIFRDGYEGGDLRVWWKQTGCP